MHVITLTAAEIAAVVQSRQHGPLEHELLELLARLRHFGGRTVFVRIDYPGEPNGGLALRCRRGTWWSKLLWWIAGAPLKLW